MICNAGVKENAPSMQNDRAEIRKIESYCYGQFTEGRASPRPGRSHVHWLTGAASTVMVGCVEGVLGMRPDLGGIKIAPSIPKEWKALEIQKDFRGYPETMCRKRCSPRPPRSC